MIKMSELSTQDRCIGQSYLLQQVARLVNCWATKFVALKDRRCQYLMQ